MNNSELYDELATNFIEYAASVNSDRAIPNATDGLKPVAKRILYGAYSAGYNSKKPHVKCARIVGEVMGRLHPHGDSSIYGALVRLAQPWALRYPLIDFHGNMGNIDGDGPAAYRYTEARLSTLAEDGMLFGMKKNVVNFIHNYDESDIEPTELPSIFPNLLCNPNAGIGVAIASAWAPHNLTEVAAAIEEYLDGKEPMLPGPDFPTGGVVINKNDIPSIMKTGHGSVKIRAKYILEKNNIVFTEIPYGVTTETIMTQIGELSDKEEIVGITEIRNESNKKGLRLVVECDKNVNLGTILNKLFAKTSLQNSFSYNQVALVNKTPTELNLKDCIKIYVEHNINCISREIKFDIQKTSDKLEIANGLLKALEDIDNIITLIKKSESAAAAQEKLCTQYKFSAVQAKAIVDMKLGRLAGLEKIELQTEKKQLEETLEKLNAILSDPQSELRRRLQLLVKKYGDARRTELTQIEITKEEKETQFVEPEKVVVTMTKSGFINRIPAASYRVQRKNGKGIKTANDIITNTIRTNTIDQLMIFTNKGIMYRLLVDNIPAGTNTSSGVYIKNLVNMSEDETPEIIYSIYKDTDAKYVLFATKNGLVKRTALSDFVQTKKKTGITAITMKEADSLAAVTLVKDEDLLLITKNGMCIRFSGTEIAPSSRNAVGIKGMGLNEGDEILTVLPVRNANDYLATFTEKGLGKKIPVKDFLPQKRGGKGVGMFRPSPTSGRLAAAALVDDTDNVLITGINSSICISATDIPVLSKVSIGNQLLKNGNIVSVTKV